MNASLPGKSLLCPQPSQHQIEQKPEETEPVKEDFPDMFKRCVPVELYHRITRHMDVESIINLQKAANIGNQLLLAESLYEMSKKVEKLPEKKYKNIFRYAAFQFKTLVIVYARLDPFLPFLKKSTPLQKVTLSIALVNDKILFNPSSTKTQPAINTPTGTMTAKQYLSDHRCAIGYDSGEIHIWNTNEPHLRPISVHLYDDGDKRPEGDAERISIKQLTNHRFIAASGVKARIWNLRSPDPIEIAQKKLTEPTTDPLQLNTIKAFPINSSLTYISEDSMITVKDGIIKRFDLKESSEGELLPEKTIKTYPTFLNKENWQELERKSVQTLISIIQERLDYSKDKAIETINIHLKNQFSIKKIVLANEHVLVVKNLNIGFQLFYKSLEIHGLLNDFAEPAYEDGYLSIRADIDVLNIKKTGHIAATCNDKIRLWNHDKLSGSPHILEGHTSDVFKLAELDNGLLASLSDSEMMIWDLKQTEHPCIASLNKQNDSFFDVFQLSGGSILTWDRSGYLYAWNLSDLLHEKNRTMNESESPIPIHSIMSPIKYRLVPDDFCSKDGKILSEFGDNYYQCVIDLFASPLSHFGNR